MRACTRTSTSWRLRSTGRSCTYAGRAWSSTAGTRGWRFRMTSREPNVNRGPLAGRVTLVAGAGRGIGRAISREFARNGARLTLAARTRDELEETARACRRLGAAALVAPADVARWPQVEALVRQVVDDLGPPDVLVNAAGVIGPI